MTRLHTFVCMAGLLLPTAGLAQETGLLPGTSNFIADSVGIAADGDDWIGESAHYAVRFTADGVEFTAAHATDAPVTPRLRFRMESAGRRNAGTPHTGMVTVLPDGDPERRIVQYVRAGCTEVYELGVQAVEQSFVFSTLPPGTGDLVVRGSIETDLPLASAAVDEIRYGSDEAGVRIGAVVGIDADGDRVAGKLHLEGDALELSLPAAWVEGAALPIVLDPPIGGPTPLISAWDDGDPDVAYNWNNDVYLVVWQRAGFGIRGQFLRLDSFGGLSAVGSTIFIQNSGSALDPHVAINYFANTFAVVWTQTADILGATIPAATGVVSGPFTIAGGGDAQVEPDIGGDYNAIDDEAIVVWWNITKNRVQAAQFNTTSGFAFPPVDITLGFSTDRAPAISKSGGPSGRFLIAYQRTTGGVTSIEGALVTRDLTFIDQSVDISRPLLFPAANYDPAVDGDGTHWIVAYEEEAVAGSGDTDIVAVAVGLNPNTGATYRRDERVIANRLSTSERDPAVAWLGSGTALVGYIEDPWGRVGLTQISAYTTTVHNSWDTGLTPTDENVMIASSYSGAGKDDMALVAWEGLPNVRDVNVQGFRADDGIVTNYPMICGNTGTAVAVGANSPTLSTYSFEMLLVDTPPTAGTSTKFLVLGAEAGNWRCSNLTACTLVPDPFRSVVLPTTNYANGAIGFSSPVPVGLSGMTLYMQWWVPSAGSGCNGYSLSNALQVQFQ